MSARAYQGLAPLAINRGPLRGRGTRAALRGQSYSRGNEPLAIHRGPIRGRGTRAALRGQSYSRGNEPLAINRGPIRGRTGVPRAAKCSRRFRHVSQPSAANADAVNGLSRQIGRQGRFRVATIRRSRRELRELCVFHAEKSFTALPVGAPSENGKGGFVGRYSAIRIPGFTISSSLGARSENGGGFVGRHPGIRIPGEMMSPPLGLRAKRDVAWLGVIPGFASRALRCRPRRDSERKGMWPAAGGGVDHRLLGRSKGWPGRGRLADRSGG